MTTTYTYLGTFTSPNSNVNPTAAGIPAVASYNPYNGSSGTSTVLASNPAAQVTASITSFQNENVITTLNKYNTFYGGVTVSIAAFVVGSMAGFNNAFGVAVSTSAVNDPSTISSRWILVPNCKSAISNASTQPAADAYTVTGGYSIPFSINVAPTSGSVLTTDGHGTAIADHTLQNYVSSGMPHFYYPFLIPNAWKYDPTAASGSRWYVGTSVQPWWMFAHSNPALDTNTEHVVYDNNSSHQIQSSDFSGTHSALPNVTSTGSVYGFENFVINTAETLNPSTLNQDFNDFVFALVSFH